MSGEDRKTYSSAGNERRKSALLFLAAFLGWAFLAISLSVAAPLLCRPFYYAHIDGLDLPENTGFTEEQIRAAFDEMMDFCVQGKPFGTGELLWSESGKAHFEDCAVLFRLDFLVAAVSACLLLCCFLARRKGAVPARICGRGPRFFAGLFPGVAFLITAALAARDFDRAFVTFHHLFFPGKENWLFDYRTDQIILILPEEFFRNCAILIVGLLFVFCLVLILSDRAGREEG